MLPSELKPITLEAAEILGANTGPSGRRQSFVAYRRAAITAAAFDRGEMPQREYCTKYCVLLGFIHLFLPMLLVRHRYTLNEKIE